MSEVQLYPGVRMSTSGMTDLPPNSAELQRVWLWDVGPSKPVTPKRPTPPKGKEGDPEFDLAKVEFAEHLDDYAAALKEWKKAKEDYAAWHKKNGGPVEIQSMWSCDAADALHRDEQAVKDGRQEARRYYVSSRTRGHSGVPNRGLPEGAKPGHGQAENERRELEGDADLAAARKSDPVFGKQELRA